VLTHSLGVLAWSATNVLNLEIGVRKVLTKYRAHHPRASVERITLPRGAGGRGMVCLGSLLGVQVRNLRQYFTDKQPESLLHRAIVESDTYTPLKLSHTDPAVPEHPVLERLTAWTQNPWGARAPVEYDLVAGLIHQELAMSHGLLREKDPTIFMPRRVSCRMRK